MFKKKKNKNNIHDMIKAAKKIHKEFILDDENAIILVKDIEQDKGYSMIHYKMIDGKIIEINKWPIKAYYFGYIENITILPELNLFQIQNNNGGFDAIYNYKEGKFVIPLNTWDLVEVGPQNSILNKYNGFLASFTLHSDFELDDFYMYNSPITGERILKTFGIKDGYYYAIINIDGTIRGNKLFKGESFSTITEIIDLDKYESLDSFKNEIIQLCNKQKNEIKKEYYQLLEKRKDENNSPDIQNEVANIINNKSR